MRYCVIANPHARNGRGRRRLRELEDLLQRRGLSYDLKICDGFERARSMSEEANRTGYDVIVGAGGDGTINRVLNGFFDDQGRRLSPARLGVVHLGTSPDFCRSYGIPTELGAAVNALAAGRIRRLAVGRVAYEPTQRRPAYFGCCANIGLGATLARRANGGIRKYAGDFAGTLLCLLRTLLTYRPHPLQVTMDGEARTLEGVVNISIGKTFHVASGLKIHHELKERDERFYVLCLRQLSCRRLAGVLRSLYGGRPIQPSASLSLEYAREIQIDPLWPSLEVEFDGDPAGVCPCQIETAADPLELIVEDGA